MGLFSCQSDLARPCPAADCGIDHAIAQRSRNCTPVRALRACLIFWASVFWANIFWASIGFAQPSIRIATYEVGLTDRGPGLVLQSLTKGGDDQQKAIVASIAALGADVLLLTEIDYDLRGETLAGLNQLLAGTNYPYMMALRPNTGLPTGFDIDQNGRKGEARDAMAFGRYLGAEGMAVLSKLPLGEATDYSGFIWADLPQNLSPDTDPALRRLQRLSTSGHYQIAVQLPDGRSLALLVYAATPPVFDGPTDRNGKRNHDETAFWSHLITGDLPFKPPKPPFVVIGKPNLDPMDGQGLPAAITALMGQLQDPAPSGDVARVDADQRGNPRLDTALFDDIGGLRLDQILLSQDIQIQDAGVLWPRTGDPLASVLATASPHRPVWVDIRP